MLGWGTAGNRLCGVLNNLFPFIATELHHRSTRDVLLTWPGDRDPTGMVAAALAARLTMSWAVCSPRASRIRTCS